jgi:uncharacterized protein YkwD
MSKATRRVAFQKVNQERESHGRKPLVWDPILGKSSQAAAKVVHRDKGPLKHVAKWFLEIYKRGGKKRFGEIGECLGEGQSSSTSLVKMWHESEIHERVMNDRDVTHGAIGHYGKAWCLHTGERS